MEKKVGYCYPSGLEKTLCKWDIYVPLVTKGLIQAAEGKIFFTVLFFFFHGITAPPVGQGLLIIGASR